MTATIIILLTCIVLFVVLYKGDISKMKELKRLVELAREDAIPFEEQSESLRIEILKSYRKYDCNNGIKDNKKLILRQLERKGATKPNDEDLSIETLLGRLANIYQLHFDVVADIYLSEDLF